MSVFWLQPLAWWGLAALAIPILVHLLARQRSRRLLFPTLRFLRATRLAAVRRQVVSDWPLLAVRLLIVAAAIAALAAPVLVSAARQRSWNTRVARAVLVMTPAQDPSSVAPDIERLVQDERATSFVSAVFTPADAADGVRDASIWLQRQPPAERELVVVGDLRVGSLTGDAFDLLAPSTGVRFLPVTPPQRAETTRLSAIADTDAGDGAERFTLDVTPGDESTSVSRGRGIAPLELPVEVRATPSDQPRVEAALRAVLDEGVALYRNADRRVIIEFDGASPAVAPLTQPASQLWMRRVLEQLSDLRGGEQAGALLVRAGNASADASVAQTIARIVHGAFADDLRDLEPRPISPRALAQWSRPAGPVPEDVRPTDEGDRRILWAAVLVLLAVEYVMRRARSHAGAVASQGRGNTQAEARVA